MDNQIIRTAAQYSISKVYRHLTETQGSFFFFLFFLHKVQTRPQCPLLPSFLTLGPQGPVGEDPGNEVTWSFDYFSKKQRV